MRGGACLRKRVPCCRPPDREGVRERNIRIRIGPILVILNKDYRAIAISTIAIYSYTAIAIAALSP